MKKLIGFGTLKEGNGPPDTHFIWFGKAIQHDGSTNGFWIVITSPFCKVQPFVDPDGYHA